MSRSLLLEIARCSNIAVCRSDPRHPCRAIVDVQAGQPSHQVPEPWNGDLANAPILFVSSNPSIGFEEHYPDETWSDERVVEFFEGRFGHWMKDGVYGLRKDGKRGPAVRFNSGARNCARILLGRDPVPGRDYVFTEVVHCKSKKETGVRDALDECTRRYLGRILAASGARVLVVYGRLAHQAVARLLSTTDAIGLQGPVGADGRARHLVNLPHPTAYTVKRVDRVLDHAALVRVRGTLL